MLDLGYTSVSEAACSFATLGLAMYFCWGYEMGASEAGVCGGCQATPTRTHALAVAEVEACKSGRSRWPETPATDGPLSGCDMLRLALERSATAKDAVLVIMGLLEQYGQWGSSVLANAHRTENDNAYVFADSKEAWLCETAGRHCVARRIGQGCIAASNALQIGTDFDMASESCTEYAIAQGWWLEGVPLNFKVAYADTSCSVKQAEWRCRRSVDLMEQRLSEEGMGVSAMKAILRDHVQQNGISLCMHECSGWSTISSMAVELAPSFHPCILVCCGPPCTGLYLPLDFKTLEHPAILSACGNIGNDRVRNAPRYYGPDPSKDSYNSASYWWHWHEASLNIAAMPQEQQLMLIKEFASVEEAWSKTGCVKDLNLIVEASLELARGVPLRMHV